MTTAPVNVRRQRKRVGGLIALLLGVICVCICWWQADALERWWYQRFRGGDLTGINIERYLQMRDAGRTLVRFEQEHDRLPRDLDEWLEYAPQLAQHLARPEYSIRGGYVFVPEGWTAERPRPILEDPGIDWPGEPAIQGRTPPHFHVFRVGLLSDGTLMEYDWDAMTGEVVRRRAGTSDLIEPLE